MQIQTKKLNRVRLINWMYFGEETFPVNQGSVLISGENAAGKSTVLDAIQMVLTGNSTKFNKAANENSDRDLKSYVRCKIDTTEKTYLRDGNVISNVALEFYEEKENRWFVIGVHLSSPNENDPVSKKWYIENGKLEDFSFLTEDNKPSMADEFRNRNEKIRFIKQVSEYKDNLRHRLGNLEEKYFEVLLKALAFRPVDDVKDFINKYVLPEKTIDVQALRESIDVLNEFERTLKKAKSERDALEVIMERFSDIDINAHNQSVYDLLLKIIERDVLEKKKQEYLSNIRIDTQKHKSVEAEKNQVEDDLQKEREKLFGLRQTFENSDYSRLTDKLQSAISQYRKDLQSEEKRVEELTKDIRFITNYLALFTQLQVKTVPVSAEEVKSICEVTEEGSKAEIINTLETFVKSEIDEIRREYYTADEKRKVLADEISCTEKMISELESQTIHYPRETEDLRNLIQQNFYEKGIDSTVYIFAELLNIKDKQWSNAIEGYLNTQRFYLVVEPEHYNLALEIYNANRKSYNQGIVNFRKLPESSQVLEKSLAQLVETDNRYARRFADYVLGSVICCEQLYELEQYSSAITKDCMVYKNYVSRKIDPKVYQTPYIGKDAIEVQLKNAKKRYKGLLEQVPAVREKMKVYKQITDSYELVNFDMIKKFMDAPDKLKYLETKISEAQAELDKITKSPDIIQLQSQISETEEQEKRLDKKKDTLVGEERSLSDRLKTNELRVNEIHQELEFKIEELTDFQDYKADLFNEATDKYKEITKDRTLEQAQENYSRQKAVYDNKALRLLQGEKSYKGLYQLQSEFNTEFGKDYETGLDSYPQYKTQFDKLNGVQIVYYEESIRSARDKCEDIFKNEFLSKMRESIESANYEFDNLKKALKNINYGEDTYRFIISPNNQKRNLYNMIMADENLGMGNLFTDNFESQYREEINELFDKIKMGDSTDKTVKEYTDYRTYLDYDIEITKKNGSVQRLSAKAKSNSGGESQVPFYVIMAASLNNIYKSNNSVRLLLLDEAFNNMDEQRIRSVMTFFNELQFQTILVAPSPKIQDIEENVDTVLTVMREDTVSFVEDFRYYGE